MSNQIITQERLESTHKLIHVPPLSTFRIRDKSPLDTKIFLDESGTVDISRSDIVKYPIFEKQADRMFSAMWRFQEINLSKDKYDFNEELNEVERFIFTSNLQRQIMLDTQQSLGLVESLLPLTSDPMVKRCINIINFFEELHNMTYEHIIKNVYNDPSEVMDGIKNVDQIVKCGESIGRYYDDLLMTTAKYRLGMVTEHEVKRKIWMTLHSINALEGIRFYVSFACSFSFGQSGRMVGNSSEIKLIANDESFHQAFTTALIRTLPEDDPEFAAIQMEMKEEATELFLEVVRDEKNWATYIFQEGPTIGLNKQILDSEIDWLAEKRMRSVHLTYPHAAPAHRPIPWMNKWLNESAGQSAPQETEVTSYTLSVANDLGTDSFVGIELD